MLLCYGLSYRTNRSDRHKNPPPPIAPDKLRPCRASCFIAWHNDVMFWLMQACISQFLLLILYRLCLTLTTKSKHILHSQFTQYWLLSTDRAVVCVIVFAKSRRLELRQYFTDIIGLSLWYNRPENMSNSVEKTQNQGLLRRSRSFKVMTTVSTVWTVYAKLCKLHNAMHGTTLHED